MIASLWPIPTPPATALDVDLAPVITVTTLLDGVPTSGVLVSAGGSVTPVTSGVGGVAVLVPPDNGTYTVAAAGAGASWATAEVTVLDQSVSVSLAGTAVIPDPRPLSIDADVLAVRLLAVIEDEVILWPEVWYSDYGLTTDVTDTPSATVIEERLLGEVRYRARVVPLVWGRGEGAAPVGQITLANADGALDAIVGAGWTGRVVEIYRGDRDLPVSDWTLLVRTRLAAPPAGDEETVTLTMGSIADRLDQPLQSEVFPDDTPAEALRGQVRPFGVGYCYSVPALLVDPADLRYEVHDGTDITIDRVRAAGNILTPGDEWELTPRGFRLLINPFGARVVADVQFGDPSQTGQQTVASLLARFGITDLSMPGVAWPRIGAWVSGPASGADLLSYLLDGMSAAWCVDRFDRLTIRALDDFAPPVPAESAWITEDVLTTEPITMTPDLAPGYVDVMTGGRNWHVHAPTELAGALVDPEITPDAVALQADYRFRARGSGDDLPPGRPSAGYAARPGGAASRSGTDGNGIVTALVDSADVAAEALRLRAIFAADRLHRFIGFERLLDINDGPFAISSRSFWAWGLWDWVYLSLPRFGAVGSARIVAVDIDLATGAARVECWLPAPAPFEPLPP